MAGQDHHVDAVGTALAVVEALDRRGPSGVTEIARETGINKSSVYKHLDTLRHRGFVTKAGGEYALSLRWLGAGERVRDRYDVLEVAREDLDALARRFGETVSLVVEEDGDAVYLYQRTDGEAAGPVPPGGRIPAAASVGGKAILAYHPEESVRALLSEGDIDVDPDELLPELASLRDARMVVEREGPLRDAISAGDFEGHRHVTGHDDPYGNLNGVAVPVRDGEGRAVAAVEVSGPEASLSGRRLEEEVAGRLVSVGRSIEASLVQGRSA